MRHGGRAAAPVARRFAELADFCLRHQRKVARHLAEATPPGPIANPGRASLEAAYHPQSSGYLYFVAESRAAGTHVFSETLAAHQRAVTQYRRSR
jgi:hypothetical protein